MTALQNYRTMFVYYSSETNLSNFKGQIIMKRTLIAFILLSIFYALVTLSDFLVKSHASRSAYNYSYELVKEDSNFSLCFEKTSAVTNGIGKCPDPEMVNNGLQSIKQRAYVLKYSSAFILALFISIVTAFIFRRN